MLIAAIAVCFLVAAAYLFGRMIGEKGSQADVDRAFDVGFSTAWVEQERRKGER